METAINEIQKAKVKDSQLEVSYVERFREENYSNAIDKKCSQIIHADLKANLDRLKIHLVCICEMPEASTVDHNSIYDYDLSKLSNYVVTGYSHGGNDESAGVTIIGQKLLKTGKVLNLVSPFVQFEDTDSYPFASELCADVEACDYEVGQYLFHGKYGIKQLEFDFDAPDEADLSSENHIDEKPKKKGRKKKESIVALEEAV